jgi:uncharacterized protein (TIGR02996 family)
MTHDEAFLQAILENPEDDTPRLAYADWLGERDDPRGEFIRVQCRLATMAAEDGRRPPLEELERRLLEGHQDEWLDSLRPLLSGWRFRRGFLDAIRVPAATYLQRAVFRPATVRRVEVDLDGFEVPADALEFVPQSVAYENVLLPIGLCGGALVLAVQDPLDAGIEEKLRFLFNRDIDVVAAPGRQVAEAIRRYHGDPVFQGGEPDLVGWLAAPPAFPPDEVDLGSWDNGSPVARLLARLFAAALGLNAREVRIGPGAGRIRVGYTGDGGTAEGEVTPVHLLWPVVTRLRIMAGIWVDDRRDGQAGAIKLTVRGRRIDVGLVMRRRGDCPVVVLTFRPPDSRACSG